MSKKYKICFIAGEASGDNLGAKLINAIKQSAPDKSFKFIGVGGDNMQSQGLRSIFPMHELSIMGWIEIIPHIPNLLNRINQTVAKILEEKPDIVITIDAPAFNFRVAKKLQNSGIKLVHYVAPTVWAYKPKRAQKVADLYDHLLLLLPFEKPYFDKVGLNNTFVGHPIMEEKVSEGDGEKFRKEYNIPEHAPVLCVLAGSRSNEIKRLLPVFIETIALLAKKYPDLHVVFTATKRFHDLIKIQTKELNIPIITVSQNREKHNAYAASNVCLAKSGTGTFEPAMAGTPLVIAYKVNPISAWLLRRMIKTPFVNLINIISGKEIIPEFLQEECTAKNLQQSLTELIDNKSKRDEQIKDIKKSLQKMTLDKTPSNIAAQAILKIMQ